MLIHLKYIKTWKNVFSSPVTIWYTSIWNILLMSNFRRYTLLWQFEHNKLIWYFFFFLTRVACMCVQVYVITTHSRQRWKGLCLPWYVQHDHRQSSWRRARFYLLLWCDCIVGQSADRSASNDSKGTINNWRCKGDCSFFLFRSCTVSRRKLAKKTGVVLLISFRRICPSG